jgi:hypothetical protein
VHDLDFPLAPDHADIGRGAPDRGPQGLGVFLMTPGDDDEVVLGRILDPPDRFADRPDDDFVRLGHIIRVGEFGPVVDNRDAPIEERAQPGDGPADMSRPGDDKPRQGPDGLEKNQPALALNKTRPASLEGGSEDVRAEAREGIGIR